MVDRKLPKEDARIATNLLHRAALLLAPNEDTRTRITGELTQARRSARLGETDEAAISKRLIFVMNQGVAHNDWTA